MKGIGKVWFIVFAILFTTIVEVLAHSFSEGPDGINSPHCMHMTVEQAAEVVETIKVESDLEQALDFVSDYDGHWEGLEYTLEWKVRNVAPYRLGGIGMPICLTS